MSKAAMLGLAVMLDENWPMDMRASCVRALSTKAADGDMEATKLLFNYAYGKPKEVKEHKGAVSVLVLYEDQPIVSGDE